MTAPEAPAPAVEPIPAVDLLGGEVVRLYRGERARATRYGDPLEAAERFAAAGARRLHVVDLDGAFGGGGNPEPIRRLLAVPGLSVQVAGGVRTLAAYAALREAGAARVVFGTAALETPEVVEEAARRDPAGVAVALDVRAGRLRGRGWVDGAASSGETPEAAARRWADAGAGALIHTSIERDGTMEGPDLEAALRVADAAGIPTILAGGVGEAAHLAAAAAARSPSGARLAGVVLGRALYEGRFTLAEARAALTLPG